MKINHLVKESFGTTHPYEGVDSIQERLGDNSFLVVVDSGSFLGIITPSDIIESPHRLVIDCLHDKPRVDMEQDVESVSMLMKASRNSVLPVFNGDVFIGVVTQTAITDYLFEYRKELELSIFERTAELAKSNQQLKREIEERKQGEEQIRKLCCAIEQSIDGMAMGDLESRLTYVNNAFARMHGYSPEEMIGMEIGNLHNEDQIDEYKRAMHQIMTQGSWAGEMGHVKKDGTTFPAYTSANLFKSDSGTPIAMLAVTKDITELKKIEEGLLRAQKLEAVGVLAGGIAHDFNNFLAGIFGYIALAKLHQTLEPETLDMLSKAEKVILQVTHLAAQLLTFSAGGAPVKRIVSISQLLRDMATFALSGSNVKCEVSISDDLYLVEADEGQIGQVINNLVINAAQAMPEGGTLKIYARNVIVDEAHGTSLRPGRYIQIAIEDQGVGIAKEHLDKVFDPYFSTKEKGRGLGLAVTYSIIKKHNGHVSVESQFGAGTTFYIYLPAASKQAVEGKEKKCETPSGEGRRILVMDDEEIVREIVVRILKHLGYEVELVRDGLEALQVYEKAKEIGSPFDAVIFDLTIPGGMGGKEAIMRLLEIDPEAKAIVSSGYSDDPVMAEFSKYGFRGAIQKPYNIEELSQTLNDVVGSPGAGFIGDPVDPLDSCSI